MAAGPRRATLPHAVHAVIFDMDGTLFDSEILYQRGLVQAGAAFGLAIGADISMRTVGASWAATRQLLHEEFGHICHPDRLIAHWKAVVETLCSQALAQAGHAGITGSADAPRSAMRDRNLRLSS